MYNVWTLPECLMKSCLISNNASERSHLNPQYKPAVRFLSLSPATPSVSPPFLSPSDKCLPFTSSLLPAVYISVCVSPRSTSAIIPVAVPLFFSTWPPSLSSSHYIAARLPPPPPPRRPVLPCRRSYRAARVPSTNIVLRLRSSSGTIICRYIS